MATRMFWVAQETNSPMPKFSDDEVVDYMVREAIVTRVGHERQEKEKENKRLDWRKDHKTWAKEMGLV